MTDKTQIGRRGENLAADYLVKQGFEIVARNYRYGKAEIDLIVKRADWLSYYLAKENGVEPDPIESIVYLKGELDKLR